jgi:hypothetical protein
MKHLPKTVALMPHKLRTPKPKEKPAQGTVWREFYKREGEWKPVPKRSITIAEYLFETCKEATMWRKVPLQLGKKTVAVLILLASFLAAGLSAWGQAASLDDQAKCSKQAEWVFQSQRNDSITYADFTSHYNPKLGMCVVRIKVETSDPKGYIVTVKDAFENVTLGMYANTFPWQDINKGAGGITVDGKYQSCGSLIEFNALAQRSYGIAK